MRAPPPLLEAAPARLAGGLRSASAATVPAPRHDHARRAQQAIPQQVSRLQLVDDRVRRYRLVDDLCHRLVSRGVEGLAARLDARDAVPSERPEQVAPHELDALQK